MRRNSGGFLLAEVLLALTVLAVGVVAAFQASTLSLRALEESARRHRAALVLEEKFWELERVAVPSPRLEWEVDVLGRVELEVEEAPLSPETGGPVRRGATLSWGEGRRRNHLTLAAYRP